jgi:hypothetical protein
MVRAALSAFVSTARDLLEGRELDGLLGAMSGREITEIFQRRLAVPDSQAGDERQPRS